LICFSAGCGGEFEAQINGGTVSGTPQIPVTVWCSDYQLNVTTGSQYAADVSLLSNITKPTDPSVQYGNLPNGSVTWNNALTSGLLPAGVTNTLGTVDYTSDTSTAAYRFTLAAALVSQYVSAPGTPGFLDGGSSQNMAIQEAIWYLTSNNTSGTDSAFSFGAAVVGDSTNYAYWLNYVLTNQNDVVSNLNLNQWAVISALLMAPAE